MKNFKALIVREQNDDITYQIELIEKNMLSKGNVLIKIAYSSVNYKDMLAVQPKGGVIRHYPMIPGIDFSGTIIQSTDPKFTEGQEVLVTGYKIGMSHTGGFSEYACVPSDWIIPLPTALTLRNVMIYGTAGLTAALSIIALENHGMCKKLDPQILVTGASGGVGSIALKILSKLGYKHITALVRKTNQIEVAKKMGATEVILLENFSFSGKLLSEETFNYVLDTVGGPMVSNLLPYISYQGSIAACGNAGGIHLNTTILPFILRGINLLGIDSVNIDTEKRTAVWKLLADEWDVTDSLLVNEITLNELPNTLNLLKHGQHLGRSIVKINPL